eukprot:TRINITY_DN15202_c0_g1_i1.p2 TRINITY_DN15202_c0_g1~~TRINITY_DN15202_c0_g1_i1.p2  ORF type:complete len:131 (-),score=20.31 TRINITY_DN15202_c0_g1_i1:106-498(-)
MLSYMLTRVRAATEDLAAGILRVVGRLLTALLPPGPQLLAAAALLPPGQGPLAVVVVLAAAASPLLWTTDPVGVATHGLNAVDEPPAAGMAAVFDAWAQTQNSAECDSLRDNLTADIYRDRGVLLAPYIA